MEGVKNSNKKERKKELMIQKRLWQKIWIGMMGEKEMKLRTVEGEKIRERKVQ